MDIVKISKHFCSISKLNTFKTSAGKAEHFLLKSFSVDRGDENIVLTVSNIKRFFHVTPANKNDAFHTLQIEANDVAGGGKSLIDL